MQEVQEELELEYGLIYKLGSDKLDNMDFAVFGRFVGVAGAFVEIVEMFCFLVH